MNVAEPSDLTIDETGTILWTVSDTNNKIYRLDLQGNITKTLSYVGNDLEGVAYDRRDHTLWLAEEEYRAVIHVDTAGAIVLNERSPGLFIPLKSDFSYDVKYQLTFAGDYSAMTYDPQRRCFWIMSDESMAMFLCTGPNVVHAEYALSSRRFEGIALDPAGKYVYAVNDSARALYVFQNTVPVAPAP
ncbi:MAG: hypothetical protein E6K72_08790 [Candidatus Eisenbacteria bacterium]|uniref:Lactonase family protein n=1 Tax=Eiseniibacteriota bacterium TaxID=2212470 RepID=A0A538SNM0_UNCEI|nr:MAG: hypothetical protein E6K72_08790 [Candidatus Eisenbacteria bacterium]